VKKENRWTHGTTDLFLSTLPEGFKDRHGCSLQSITFDSAVGEEACAIYLEEPDFAEQYGEVSPFNLVVHSGLVRTLHGVVSFIVWQIAAGTPQEVMVEQYINPHNIGAIRLVASAANQTHFKLVVINNQNGEVAAFVDFENVFQFDQLLSDMTLAIGHEPEGDFGAATQHVMDNVTVTQLIALSALGMSDPPLV
jgi:hypothetical protein